MSTERVVADATVADDFASLLGEKAGEVEVGDPRDPRPRSDR